MHGAQVLAAARARAPVDLIQVGLDLAMAVADLIPAADVALAGDEDVAPHLDQALAEDLGLADQCCHRAYPPQLPLYIYCFDTIRTQNSSNIVKKRHQSCIITASERLQTRGIGVSPVLAGLKRAREAKFLSQQELANLSGISRATIARIETGDSARGSTVRKLAGVLGVEPAELVGGPSSEQPA